MQRFNFFHHIYFLSYLNNLIYKFSKRNLQFIIETDLLQVAYILIGIKFDI